jgi:diaminopropionate ammonia-lyase
MLNGQSISKFALNPRAQRCVISPALQSWLGRGAPDEVRRLLNLCPLYEATPLFQLTAMSNLLGLGAIHAKDDGNRLKLGSFKALGGAYAVAELVLGWASEHLQRYVAPSELMTMVVKDVAKGRTVCCATDGNHGMSVAAGARLFGCKAVIFVHQHVANERRTALQSLGADVVEVTGVYDDSVDACAEAANRNNWQLVSDTSWNSDTTIPARVMQGYTVLVDEALRQIDEPPTHVFVQGGVGGLAGAVAGHLASIFDVARPMIIIVEPDRAGCLMASVLAGGATEIAKNVSTIMSMLECYRPSDIAWPVLDKYADAFITLPENAAPDIMKYLARPLGADPIIVAGESGGVGLAGLIAAAQDSHIREMLKLNHQSRVLTFITEGATAPENYRQIVGCSADNVISNSLQNRIN